MHTFIKQASSFNYDEYLQMMEEWAMLGSNSSDSSNSKFNEFTKLNLARVKRLHKTILVKKELADKIKELKDEYAFLLLTESWCGDGAQNIPAIAEIAKLNPEKIKLRILLRDENPDVMDNYLTRGARAIPKLVVINNSTHKEEFVWGPRPMQAQNMLYKWKENPADKSWDEFEKELHTWYNNNKTEDLQNELYSLIKGLQ